MYQWIAVTSTSVMIALEFCGSYVNDIWPIGAYKSKVLG